MSPACENGLSLICRALDYVLTAKIDENTFCLQHPTFKESGRIHRDLDGRDSCRACIPTHRGRP